MAAGISRPDVWMGVALNRDPNDPNTPPIWTSLQSSDLQVLAVTGQSRGRDYELAQPVAGDPVVAIRDQNEYLNPDNPSSPYAGQVLPYREIAALCQWPITPVGGAVNLINSGTWRGSGVDGYEPTFDNFSTGFAAPNWLDRYGGITATISTSNPFQGAKSVQYTVAASTASQGIGLGVPVIPGRQYTTSAYVRQTSASTQQIFVEGILACADAFRRTSVDSPGTPDASFAGGAYATFGGGPTDYQVTPGAAVQIASTVNVARACVIGAFQDSEQTITVTAPALATGAAYCEGLISRCIDTSNHYRALLRFGTDGSITLLFERRLTSTTVLASRTLPFSYAAGDRFTLSFTTYGSSLEAHCWREGQREALFFQISATDTSAALAGPAGIGFVSYRDLASTNTDLPCQFADYGAYGSVAGTSTATTNTYVRLAVTYTANQLARPAGCNADTVLFKPTRGLNVVVRTVGTAVAGTVNVDAIQHEQGAAASTFTSVGPNIFPLFRNYVERYPRTWRARGYEGVIAAPCVDALALLNKIHVSNPVDQSILNAQPMAFWTLGGGSDSTLFADSSGNGVPALTRYVSKYGAGTDIEAGVGSALTGNPDGLGVHFTQSGVASSAQAPGTALGTTALTWPPGGTNSGIWELSFACWASVENLAGARFYNLFSWTRDGASTGSVVGVWFQIDDSGGAGTNTISLNMSGPGGITSQASGVSLDMLDGLMHHFAFTVSVNGANVDITVYVDGVDYSGSHVLTGGWPAGTSPMRYLTVGLATAGLTGYGWNGIIAKPSLWGRALTSSEVNVMVSAGQVGLNGETSGARELRHLQEGPYRGPTRIAQSTPSAPQINMGIPSFGDSIDLLTDSLNTMQAEQGMIWVQPDGVVAFEGRQQRWLRTLSNYTFGETAASGELPYQDGIVFDCDPAYVFPIVTWTRNGGATALGGLPIDRQKASQQFFPRQFDGSNDLFADVTAQDLSDWIFYSHRAPNTRVAMLVLDPWGAQGTPYSMWAVALRLEVSARATVTRRAKAANGGAGLTVSLPVIIEKVSTPEMMFVKGQERWIIELQLSPVGSAANGEPTVQPWILGDATYGVLDSTTVLGF